MTMTHEGGKMGMAYVDGIDVPAGRPVSLNPSGLHVWLSDLNQPLTAGQSFAVTLKFERAGEKRVDVAVLKPSAPAPMAGMKM